MKRNFFLKIVVESSNDVCTIVAGGVTLHEAVKASEKLKGLGKAVRVIDLFTVKHIRLNSNVHGYKRGLSLI